MAVHQLISPRKAGIPDPSSTLVPVRASLGGLPLEVLHHILRHCYSGDIHGFRRTIQSLASANRLLGNLLRPLLYEAVRLRGYSSTFFRCASSNPQCAATVKDLILDLGEGQAAEVVLEIPSLIDWGLFTNLRLLWIGFCVPGLLAGPSERPIQTCLPHLETCVLYFRQFSSKQPEIAARHLQWLWLAPSLKTFVIRGVSISLDGYGPGETPAAMKALECVDVRACRIEPGVLRTLLRLRPVDCFAAYRTPLNRPNMPSSRHLQSLVYLPKFVYDARRNELTDLREFRGLKHLRIDGEVLRRWVAGKDGSSLLPPHLLQLTVEFFTSTASRELSLMSFVKDLVKQRPRILHALQSLRLRLAPPDILQGTRRYSLENDAEKEFEDLKNVCMEQGVDLALERRMPVEQDAPTLMAVEEVCVTPTWVFSSIKLKGDVPPTQYPPRRAADGRPPVPFVLRP